VKKVLLVEPAYRAKLPPLGLMRLATYHKQERDNVTFVRGMSGKVSGEVWDRIYIATMFTYDLPLVVDTVKFYTKSACQPSDVFLGGPAATLMPHYIKERCECSIVAGPLSKPGMLGTDTPAISDLIPDYSILDSVKWSYKPDDAYFCRATIGCIRKCGFCAVPHLEPEFGECIPIREQIRAIRTQFGERQNLVMLDNNVLASPQLPSILSEIRDEGFAVGARRNGRKRYVDFNQGIDARLITPSVAKQLASIALSPVRLAFDCMDVKHSYCEAVRMLAEVGFTKFTTYVMFNYNDTPEDFFKRLWISLEMSDKYEVQITSFPMRYSPIDDVKRGFVSPGWRWRLLRGVQCILSATRGLVSPNSNFFRAAFGGNEEAFIEIASMPDDYIIHRQKYRDLEAAEWLRDFRKLTTEEKSDFLILLDRIHYAEIERTDLCVSNKFSGLIRHYFHKHDNSKK
jgi:hypothetical protein